MRKPKQIKTIADLTFDNLNANVGTEYGTGMLEDSLRTYGAGRSILADKNGKIIAGNKTAEMAGQIGIEDVEVVQVDGNRLVVVQRTDLDMDKDIRARELGIVDNRSGEVNLGWNPDALKQLAESGVNLEKFWSKEALRKLVGSENGNPDLGPQIDKAAELQEKWGTELGQLWEIESKSVPGKSHRIICGDCTDRATVHRLMDGQRSGLMNTDPPYGVDYANDERPNPGVAKPRVAKPRVANDSMSNEETQAFLERAFMAANVSALKENAAWYLWHPMLLQGYFAAAVAAAAAAAVIIHRQIVWVKGNMTLTLGMYHWKHELCFMGWVQGHKPPDYGRGNGERDQTTIWEIDSVTSAERVEFNHATPKPVGLFTVPMIKHLKAGELAYEPFAGSGPQYVAGEQTGRLVFGCELEPKYVAVILERLVNMGLEPIMRQDNGA